jgi:hypothetical protein
MILPGRATGCALGEVLEGGQVAVAAAQPFAEIARCAAVDRLQVDHFLALDHAETQSLVC